MFFKNKNVTKHAKKVDKIVTTIIIGGAIASIFGLSQTKKGKEITKSMQDNLSNNSKKAGKSFFAILGKFIAFLVSLFSKK